MGDFIYKLFPFRSLFELDGNSLTIWWVIVTILVFIFGVSKLILIVNSLKKQLQNPLESLPNLKEGDEPIFSIWKEYASTFIDFNGIKKTDNPSYEYFNETSLLTKTTNLKLITSLPSVLVGLGILGTFVGLTYGISGFNTDTTDTIQNSIKTLLSGMGTAFVTSIYGMLLSIIFTIVEKIQLNKLHNSIHHLCFQLDGKYGLTKDDERQLNINQQKLIFKEIYYIKDENENLINPSIFIKNHLNNIYESSKVYEPYLISLNEKIEHFNSALMKDLQGLLINNFKIINDEIANLLSYIDDNGNKIKTVNILRDAYDESKKQSNALQSFSTELATKIEAGFENLLLNNQTGVIPELKSLGSKIEDLATKLKDPATEMTQNVVKDLEVALNRMVEEFKSSISGSTKSELENLATMLKNAGDSLNNIPTLMNTMSDKLNQNFDKQTELTDKIISKAVSEFSKSNLEIKNNVSSLTSEVIENINLMNKNQSKIIEDSNKLLASFNLEIKNTKDTVASIKDVLNNFSDIHKQLKLVGDNFLNISESAQKSISTLNSTQLDFAKHTDLFGQSNLKTINEIQALQQISEKLTLENVEKFETIEKGLKGIFKQINDGIIQYDKTVKDSLAGYLGQYSESLTKATESISGATSSLHQFLYLLSDKLGNLDKKG